MKGIELFHPPMSGWVKVADGLPEPYKEVIVFVSGILVSVDEHNGKTWKKYALSQITKWQPLPQIPTEDK